eukprot:scaffold1552_cov144-Isochrysis_galbana.AAC.5
MHLRRLLCAACFIFDKLVAPEGSHFQPSNLATPNGSDPETGARSRSGPRRRSFVLCGLSRSPHSPASRSLAKPYGTAGACEVLCSGAGISLALPLWARKGRLVGHGWEAQLARCRVTCRLMLIAVHCCSERVTSH